MLYDETMTYCYDLCGRYCKEFPAEENSIFLIGGIMCYYLLLQFFLMD